MKNYELIINYRNGEVDKYYSRITGDYWNTAAETAEEALEEMQMSDVETFREIEENMTAIESYYVTEVQSVCVGTTYDDPEGTWEIVAVNGDEVELKSISSEAAFDSTMSVSRDEAVYFLTHDWQTGEEK